MAGDEGHLKVSEVAERARVSVRTLHHYDEIGLLRPSGRSSAGYRLYSEADVERLFQVLMFRELGLPLEAIARVLDAPDMVRSRTLREHRALLLEKRRRTDAVIQAVDRALESIERETVMNSSDMNEGFDAFANAPDSVREHQARFGEEAAQRWGSTPEYRESMRRARAHSPADWERIRTGSEASEERMAQLLKAGASPTSEAAMSAAEAMREHIERWFYPCSHAMHASLADMYEADPRFAAHYDERVAGLSAFVAAAVRANAARHGQGGEDGQDTGR